jgi:predicted AlkP superfamily phosphohydrolase/phosphomutase
MADAAHRVLMIGLELGDGRLIHQWARDGRLPRLRTLLDGGAWGWLETIAEELHVAPWPSLYTGTGPGQHGVYYTFQPTPGEQGHVRFHPGLYGRPTFWHLLDRAGRRVTVLDAPYTHLDEGFSGRQLIDWGSWAHYLATQSSPPELLGELNQACGAYPLGLEANDIGFAAVPADDMTRRILRALPAKAKAATWLMAKAPWDLFFTVFGETHAAAHYCWSPTDGEQSHLLRIYQALDSAIGELVDAAGPEVTTLIVSADAIGPNHAGWHLLPEVLARLGHFTSGDTPPPAGDGSAPARRSLDPVRLVRDLLPKDFRKSLARMLPTALRDRLAKRVDTAAIDWSRTRAFPLPTDLEGCIRINLKGREPLGIVEPGAVYERLCDELTAALGELADPATGERVVDRVIRVDTAFPGPRRDRLPDLVVTWSRARRIEVVTAPGIGTVSGPSPDPRPGTHAAPGFVLAHGPGVVPGTTIEGGHILDLAPTVLTRLGVPVPGHMEGRIWRPLADSRLREGTA